MKKSWFKKFWLKSWSGYTIYDEDPRKREKAIIQLMIVKFLSGVLVGGMIVSMFCYSSEAAAEGACPSREFAESTGSPTVERITDPKISRLVYEVFKWFNASYIAPPDIKLANASFLHAMWREVYGEDIDCKTTIRGLHDIFPQENGEIKRTIYLRNDFDVYDPSDRAGLVHEIDHYIRDVRDQASLIKLTLCETENYAYRSQRKWLLEKEGYQPYHRIIMKLDKVIAGYEADCPIGAPIGESYE